MANDVLIQSHTSKPLGSQEPARPPGDGPVQPALVGTSSPARRRWPVDASSQFTWQGPPVPRHSHSPAPPSPGAQRHSYPADSLQAPQPESALKSDGPNVTPQVGIVNLPHVNIVPCCTQEGPLLPVLLPPGVDDDVQATRRTQATATDSTRTSPWNRPPFSFDPDTTNLAILESGPCSAVALTLRLRESGVRNRDTERARWTAPLTCQRRVPRGPARGVDTSRRRSQAAATGARVGHPRRSPVRGRRAPGPRGPR